ncbi:MAG: ribonuclease H-like domain-containing protein [Clostridia bacterium]|nr:ribonuclease H-like domain-containing protein [Clostridia bacterium]MBR5379729.1 ribonuclease H-like domain-containing protein [Clostridia bacterium]MBR5751711.1 ribonuclease H-like domain-containing protein [Clostridia bacterium]
MSSRLLKKLSLLNSDAPKPAPASAGVKIYEWFCPADERLYRLNRDALMLMGYTGGAFDIERAAFIDTETTGLSGGAGTVAFLVGMGRVKDGRFYVKQYLMPDYGAEAEMLEALSEDMRFSDAVVHFNGRRFDMPLLRDRCVMKRLPDLGEGKAQLDLLYPARSVWKLRLGSCRLSFLESAVLGMPERDDIPGSEIPGRYFESVRTGNVSLLEDVVRHNRQDIVTLGTLLCELEALYTRPEEAEEQLDLFSLGRTFERQGEYRVARGLYLKASRPRPVRTVQDLRAEKYAGEANLRLYLLQRRRADYEACLGTLQNMIKRGQMGDVPKLELCKLMEHRLHRYSDALRIADGLLASALPEDREALTKRRDRIMAKLIKYGGNEHV